MRYLLLLIAVLTLTGWDCPLHSHAVNPPSAQPKIQAPETPQQKVDRLEGDLARARSERDAAQLDGVRTTVAWAAGVSALAFLVCVGLAIASVALGLGFTWKIPAALGLGFAGILGACLALSWAIAHLAWILATLGLMIALGLWWLWRHGWSLTQSARAAYAAVPETIDLGPKAEALLTRIS